MKLTVKKIDITNQGCKRNDLAGRRVAWLVWGLPQLLLVMGVFWSEARVWLWTPALVVAGLACIVNAARCGRRHCYFTGPLYLLGAAATLLNSWQIVSLHWSWILTGLVGGTALAFLAEWVGGKYRGESGGVKDSSQRSE